MDDERDETAMRTPGLPKAGLTKLHAAMAGCVSAGSVPGMVLGLSRGGDTQVLSSTGSSAVEAAFWPAAYQALDS